MTQGVAAYVINYRIKKIRQLKVTEKGDKANDLTFQNPIYDANVIAKGGSLYSHENPAYSTEDPSEGETKL